jgi:transposase-like protein
MATSRERGGDKERYWRRLVRQWRQSGLSVRTFCEERGVSEPSFYAWRRTLGERDATATAFVPVRVTPETAADPVPDRRAGDLEVVLGNGRLLRIGPDFDAATLKRVLAVLTEGQPC